MVEYLKKMLRRMLRPQFLLFILISIVIWNVNKLKGIYQNDVIIPFHVEGIENPLQSNQERYFEISCRVKSDGYNLLMLKLFPQSCMVKCNISELINSNDNKIDSKQIETILANRIENLELIRIHDISINLTGTNYTQKEVKVYSAISGRSKLNYMQTQATEFEPQYVTIKGASQLINNIDSVSTIQKVIDFDKSSINGEIALETINGVAFSDPTVLYEIKASRFIEHTKELDVRLLNIDNTNRTYRVIPSTVKICYNLSTGESGKPRDKKIQATVDISTKRSRVGNNLYKIAVTNLPKDAKVLYIEPQYVTILKEDK